MRISVGDSFNKDRTKSGVRHDFAFGRKKPNDLSVRINEYMEEEETGAQLSHSPRYMAMAMSKTHSLVRINYNTIFMSHGHFTPPSPKLH